MSDDPDDTRRADQFLVTEHTALQTARSATIFDANGRATLFLTTVSSGIVALAFVGQVSDVGTAFFMFGLVLFPTLLFVGVATFSRVLQSGIEDQIYARGINRIRHYYIEQTPLAERYFIQTGYDDFTGAMFNAGIEPSGWQLFLTTAGMVSVVNSVLGGVSIGMAVYMAAPLLALPALVSSVAVALATFIAILAAHYRLQRRGWERVAGLFQVIFPSPDGLLEQGDSTPVDR